MINQTRRVSSNDAYNSDGIEVSLEYLDEEEDELEPAKLGTKCGINFLVYIGDDQ
jgi:hypothetical protein